jgi:tetratricopeptide (TPR) repeat protein
VAPHPQLSFILFFLRRAVPLAGDLVGALQDVKLAEGCAADAARVRELRQLAEQFKSEALSAARGVGAAELQTRRDFAKACRQLVAGWIANGEAAAVQALKKGARLQAAHGRGVRSVAAENAAREARNLARRARRGALAAAAPGPGQATVLIERAHIKITVVWDNAAAEPTTAAAAAAQAAASQAGLPAPPPPRSQEDSHREKGRATAFAVASEAEAAREAAAEAAAPAAPVSAAAPPSAEGLSLSEQLREAGNIEFKAQRFEEAAQLYKEAAQADPGCKFAWSNRAAACLKLRRYADAEVAANEVRSHVIVFVLQRGFGAAAEPFACCS